VCTATEKPLTWWVAVLFGGRVVEVSGASEAEAWRALAARTGLPPEYVVERWAPVTATFGRAA